MSFWPRDWSAILLPDAPIAELLVRGTAIYFFLFVLMRIAGRRLIARLAMSDMLVMLLIAVAVREGITGDYYTLGDAGISAATILTWNLVIDRVAFSVPLLRRPLRHPPVTVIRDGRLLVENARSHLLTRMEIMARLREEGLTSLEQVREANMEPDGQISIVPR
jgi:uncharacterized membrane protein YcaP (DUF421 family)